MSKRRNAKKKVKQDSWAVYILKYMFITIISFGFLFVGFYIFSQHSYIDPLTKKLKYLGKAYYAIPFILFGILPWLSFLIQGILFNIGGRLGNYLLNIIPVKKKKD